jgi:hypothetical protein
MAENLTFNLIGITLLTDIHICFFSVLTRDQRNELLELIMPKLKQHQEHNYNCDPNDTQLFTSEELAYKIKISEKKLQTMRVQGGGPRYFKLSKGRRAPVLYDWKDVLVFLESHKRISTSDTGDN